jgi:hypothetical protein
LSWTPPPPASPCSPSPCTPTSARAHSREVERSGADWPDGSYGRRNRQAIAARATRIAARLRAVQHAYQAVARHDTTFTPPEPARTLHPRGHAANKEIELE